MGRKKSDLTPYVHILNPNIRLYNADCLTNIRSILDDGSVSVVVTSPPYNIGAKYNGYYDKISDEAYVEWLGDVAAALETVLDPSGSVFLNMGVRPSNPTLAWDVAMAFKKHFQLQNTIHWIKSIAINKDDVGDYKNIIGDIAVGHYKPTTSRRYLHAAHEYIFHFTKQGTVDLDTLAVGVPYQDKTNIGRWRSATEDKRSRGNVWFIPYKTILSGKDRPHPATFPVKLPEDCIKLHGIDRTRLVLDPFMGIGSTALACQKLVIPCVGFDTDSTYLDFAKELLLAGP